MANIPGPVTLAAGAIVSAISFLLNNKSFSFINAYSLFLYVGLFISLYGFVMTLIWFMNRTSPEEVKEEIKKDISQKEKEVKQGYMFDKIQQREHDEDRYQMVIRCRNCGMSHYVYSNFCSNCGSRLAR